MDKLRLNQLCFGGGREEEEAILFADKICHSKTVNTTNELKLLTN